MAATPWKPEQPKYGYKEVKNVGVRMDDGVVLRANVYYPTNLTTGREAHGRFPVLLEQTPYGKTRVVNWPGLERFPYYFVPRGYIYAIADLRGFGRSQGQAAWFGSRMGRDGAELADWAAHLGHADGKVGLIGCSYMGAVQFFTAEALSAGSPVKAMAPFCVNSDFYRDLIAFGGIPTQFVAVDRGYTAPGVDDKPATDPFMRTIISEVTGKDAYYDKYWRSLNYMRFMPKVVSLGIPMLTESGWYDLFPGGNLDMYVAAQNAYNHRPVYLPLVPGEHLSAKYQAIVGPWTHGEHVGGSLHRVLLRWFDTWLKGEDTGMANTDRPLHLFVRGEGRWVDAKTYPLTQRARHFGLLPHRLVDEAGVTACGKSGASAKGCSATLLWAPPGPGSTLTFDSAPLKTPLTVSGPGDVTVYVKSTRPEIELGATLFELSPAGKATKITNGAQLGSQRALDKAASWYSRKGLLIRPSHYFTFAKREPVPVDTRVRLDIELVPALIRIPAGYRLELKLISEPGSDFRQYGPKVQMHDPLTPTPRELANLTGGIYTVLFGRQNPSAINLSIGNASEFVSSRNFWGPGR